MPLISVQVKVVGAPSMVADSTDVRSLYRTHHGKDPRGSILNSRERITVIYRELSHLLDLDAAKQHGLITNWYVTHSESTVATLDDCWANWVRRPDVHFRQPLSLLKDYFGARVAFLIAWSSHYFKSLWALVPLALVEFAVMTFLNDSPAVKRKMVLSYGILLIFWQQAVANLWDREQEYLCKLWGLEDQEDVKTIRPSFHGIKQPSRANRNHEDTSYPESKAAVRRTFSSFLTVVFCLIVFTLMITWINIWEGAMSMVATMFLTIMIKVFEACYNAIVPILIDLENHKYQSTYVDSYIWKLFLFRFVNSFGAFMYLAAKQKFTKVGCPAEGCMSYLRFQLIVALALLTAIRVAQVVVKCLLVKWQIESEDRSAAEVAAAQGKDKDVAVGAGFVERQAKFPGYRFKEQIEDMLELVIALGYVFLFGAVAPSIVVFCLVVFIVQIGSNSYILLHFTQRSVPRTQNGVGAWRDVIRLLTLAGVLFSAFLFVSERHGRPVSHDHQAHLFYPLQHWRGVLHGLDQLFFPCHGHRNASLARSADGSTSQAP
jgi:hypothetical protein